MASSYRLWSGGYWKHTAHGLQAIDMIAAFGDNLNMEWLLPKLKKEAALDAFNELTRLSSSPEPVTEQTLTDLLETLHPRHP